ncbi:hypothetical protein A5792_16535 [Mycolicibacterium peregrinum]|uniref:Uncharacterized protein n=1 Tax=Mycolicibacterium peregrinum TaxID=43304 RepID=A0A1A0RBB1_MYCPR|nr:EspA/EspE family type VII secretion system effector [Mycolicibacterium peregrinum]OBB31004.1 hypothetical protein A5792_16535 [Mycolicibacterium peregrinum]
MSVLQAFLTTYQSARSNFGDDTPPQSGAPLFESSTAVRAVESGMAGTLPGDAWRGSASDAYAEANNQNIAKMGALAALDQRLGSQIDASARAVSRGRKDLGTVHDQVVSLANSVPPGPLRETMLLPIVAAGMGRIAEVVGRTTADLSDIGKDITEIADEYQKLGAGESAGSPMEEDPRKKLEDILREYQVKDDRMLPRGLIDRIGDIFGDKLKGDADLTVGEYDVLSELLATQGPFAIKDFFDIKSATTEEAIKRFPPPAPDATTDNRTDAFRHTYWNALMTQRFGEEWTRKFATAHERRPGDPAPREAMDLYNNEIGRQIGMANPDTSPQELANLVQAAVDRGDTVFVSADGHGLDWSKSGANSGNSEGLPSGDPTPYPTAGRTPGVTR